MGKSFFCLFLYWNVCGSLLAAEEVGFRIYFEEICLLLDVLSWIAKMNSS